MQALPVISITKKPMTLMLVCAASLACLVCAFRGVQPEELRRHLAGINWAYFTLAVVLNLAISLVNSWRWKTLLAPVFPVRFDRALQAICIGLLLNEVVPLRPGEVVRCTLLSRWTPRLSFAVAMSSALIEQLLEFAWLTTVFFMVVALVPVPKILVYGCIIASATVLGAVVPLVFALRRPAQGGHYKRAGLLMRTWRQVVDGSRSMADGRTLLRASLFSFLALLLNVLANWVLLRSCRILLPLMIATAVLVMIRVGTAIPSTPGNVGAYQFLAVLALGLFGVDRTAAATFTIAGFAAFSVPVVVGGAIALMIAGTGLSSAGFRRSSWRFRSTTIETIGEQRP